MIFSWGSLFILLSYNETHIYQQAKNKGPVRTSCVSRACGWGGLLVANGDNEQQQERTERCSGSSDRNTTPPWLRVMSLGEKRPCCCLRCGESPAAGSRCKTSRVRKGTPLVFHPHGACSHGALTRSVADQMFPIRFLLYRPFSQITN